MWANELSLVAEIAREAGDVLMTVYATDFSVELKDRGDPVTEADKRANEWIVTRLREAFPTDGIIAEESQTARDTWLNARIWYVDPLDGTKEFVAKNGEFSVMIGLVVDGRPVLGVVYQPSTDTLYAGAAGQGAWVERGGVRQPVQVSDQADARQLGLIVSRSHRPASTSELMQRLGIERETSSGSVGLKIGQIIERHADLYAHMSDKSSAWDACAPEAILIAAGGRFTDLSGEPIRYGREDTRMRRGLLACNTAAFEVVLPVVRLLAARAGLV